jgi:hypothetical protein
MQTIRGLGRPKRTTQPRRKIHDENVDGSAAQQRAGDRQPLAKVVRRNDDQPLQPNPARDGLDRVERPPDVEPRGDRSRRLGLRDGP